MWFVLLTASFVLGNDVDTHPGVAEYEHHFQRAGNPQCTSRLARLSNSPAYIGYYVGGGAAGHRAEGRTLSEGTWGWDYRGHPWVYRRIRLGYSHGRLVQGGIGRYTTDTIHLPDVPNAIRPVRKDRQAEAH